MMKKTIGYRYVRIAAFAFLGVLLPSIVHAEEIQIVAKTGSGEPVIYVQFAAGLSPNTHVWMNVANHAASTNLRATQRSLGFREVDYKAFVSAALAINAVSPVTSNGITTYDYSAQSSKSSNLVAFWKDKDLPIVIGPDGKAYITDGHHTTAGYLASNTKSAREIVPGNEHVVLGHIVANYNTSPPSLPTDNWWQTLQSTNNAFLYAPEGNQLVQRGDPGYDSLHPIPASERAMPTVPGKTSMTNDDYRSLTWGMGDPIVKTATAMPTRPDYVKGFSKGFPKMWVNPDPAKLQPDTSNDINFVEFYWADFLRNRVVWNNTAPGCALDSIDPDCAGKINLIAAPVSFFAAVANGVALARSEAYRDQYGRTLNDYLAPNFSANTRSWASASIQNGLAGESNTFHMFLLDDSTICGDITPSALAGVTNVLHIDTTTGQTVNGAIKNFAAVEINRGATINTRWKDAKAIQAYLGVNPETALSIPAGSGTVTFAGLNSYPGNITVGAGKLVVADSGSIERSAGITLVRGTALENLGQIKVGSYTQEDGATLEVGRNASGKIIPIVVTGAANLNGSLLIKSGSTKWSSGARYTLFTAENIKGKFSTISIDNALKPTLRYLKHKVVMYLARK